MGPGSIVTATVWGILPAAVLLGLLWWVDRYEKEPIRLMLVALGAGAVVAPALAALVQNLLDVPTSLAAQTLVPRSSLGVTTPLVEEVVRGLAVLGAILVVRHEVDGPLDGLVYGGVVGVGFGLTANVWSILQTPSLGGDTTPSLFAAMVSGLNHVFYGAVVGLGIAIWRRRPSLIAAGAAAGTVVALGFHLLHDYLPWWFAAPAGDPGGGGLQAILTGLPNALGILALAVIVAWASGREAVLVGRELREEVAAGVVTPAEYESIVDSTKRLGSLVRTLSRGGLRAARLRRRLYGLEVELAFRKHHRRTSRDGVRPLLEEDAYRERIGITRRELAAAGAET